MRNLEFSGNLYGKTVHLQQVQKRTARKLYQEGRTIYLQSSNFCPIGVWSNALPINKADENKQIGVKFDDIVQNYEWYNTCSERGYYANFYINTLESSENPHYLLTF